MIDNPSLKYMMPPSSSGTKNPVLNTVGGVAWKDLNAGKYTADDNWKMLGFDLNRNNDYAYDDAQSTGNWWNSAIHRAINPITTSFVESFRFDKTIGELLPVNYSASTDASLKDYLKKTEDLNYLYANYDNPDVGEGFKGYFSSGARNKWSSMIESSGFMIGTALGGITQSLILGAITAPEGGIGAAVGLTKTLENVYNIGKVGQLANDYNKLNKINKLWAQTKAFTKITSPGLQAIEGVSQFNAATTTLGTIKAVGKIIGNGAIRLQAASSEAMLEAIDGSDRFYKQQVVEEEKDLGRELTKEEKDKIQDYSADLFHARWAANVGILAVNNVLQDYNLFNTFKKLSKAGDIGVLAGRAAKKTVFSKSLGQWSAVSELPYKEWALHKAKTIGGFAAKNILSEGYEEWAQYAIDKSTDDYFTRKYNKQSVSFMDSVSAGVSSAYNDKEGKENFWAGAIMGGVFSGAGAIATGIHGKYTGKTAEVNNMAAGNAKRLNKEQESLNNLMKTELVMSPESESANLNNSKNDDMHNAKDKKEVEDIRRQTIVNAVKTAKEVGKYDVFIDKLRSQGKMSDEDFIKEFKIEDTKLKPSQEYINTILQEAEQVKKDLDIIDEMYVNPHMGYQNINPIKEADKRREQFTKYKGFEEAKTILLENLSSLRTSHKNITENNAWFSTKGIVADDFIAYTQKDGGTKRTDKIKELNDRIADNEELLNQSLLSAKDRKVYSNMNKELKKELKIYEDLNNDSEDTKNRIAFFNFLKKEVPQVENTSTRAFSKTLAQKLDEVIKEVDKNQTSLKAVDLLEDPMEFDKLYKKYAEEYDKRYEQVQADINENKKEDEEAQTKKEKEEATEEPFKEPEIVVEPIPTEDLDNATEDLPASKETIERVATELADKKSLSDDSKKIYSVEKNKIAIDKRKTEIELKRKEDEEKIKDPKTFTVKKKVEKLNEQKQKEVAPLKEKIAKLKKERDVLEKEPVGSVGIGEDVKQIDEIKEKISRFTKTLNDFKDLQNLSKEERQVLKEKLKSEIDSLPNDMHYFLHETSADVAPIIFNEGLMLGGNNLITTAGAVSKETLYNVLSDLIDGNIHHKGAQGAAILAFPFSEFGVSDENNKVSSQTIESKIEEDNGVTNRIPSKYVIGFFADGVLNTENKSELQAELKALEQSLKEAPKAETPTTTFNQSEIEANKADIERRRQEELDITPTAGYGAIAADYLFTGGKGVILSTDYLLQALTSIFPYSGKAIDNIRNKYADKLGDIKDDINTETYNKVIQEIKSEIDKVYNNKQANEIFEKILNNSTGFISRVGNQISSEVDKLNEKQEDKINAKYDVELARELYKELKSGTGRMVTEFTKAEQEIWEKYGTKELRDSVDAELVELSVKEEKVDNTKLDELNNEIAELEAEVKKVEDRYNKEIELEKESLIIKNEEEEKENNTEVPLVGEENTKSAVELSDDAIKDIAKRVYIFNDSEFSAGQVFKSTAGIELKGGEVQKVSEIKDKMITIKNAIYNRTRKNKKTLAELGIYVTLKKDSDEYHHESNYYEENKDDFYKHQVLTVLTDENGNDLYFTNTGMITKDSSKGIKIAEYLYDVTALDMKKRIGERAKAREKSILLNSFIEMGEDDKSRLYNELEAEVRREFEQLTEIKDYIRKTNKTITIINTSVSSGFEEKQEYEVVQVKDIKGIKGVKIEIQVAQNLESVEGRTENTQTSGFVFIQSMYEKDILILPKLKTEFGETIEYLQNDIISKSADTVLTEEEKTELNNRKKFLNAIFYRTVGSKDKATSDDHKGTDAPRKSKTTGINKIMLDGKNKQFSIVMHENNRTFDHLRVNVDKTLLETDEKIMTYKVVGGKLVSKEMLYSDFIKSLAIIVRPTKDIKNPNRRYNTVFGLDPKETFSKYQKENPVVSVPKIKVAKGTPKTDIQEETQEDLTNVFGKPLTEEEITENAVSLLDVNGFRDKFSAVGIDFKEGYRKVVFNNVESESEGMTSLRLDGLPFLDRANALPKIPVKIQTKDGRVLDRTYFVDKLIDRIEKSLLVEQTEPTKTVENEELVKDVDEEGKVVKKPEIKMGRVKKDYFNRVLVKSSILKRGITEMDIIDDLVKNNIVEKICKN